MHEMSVAQSIVEIVQQHLPPENEKPSVKSVKVRIGEFSGVVPESLEFCFDLITESTPLHGARLEIEDVALMARCKTCEEISRLEYGTFACPTCGSSEIVMLSGNELQVVAIELNDEEGTPS